MRIVLVLAALFGALAVVLGILFLRNEEQADFRGSVPPEGLELPAAAYDVAPELRGKAAAVTFLDTQCTEACPVVARQVGDALRSMGDQRDDVVAVAFSVDPEEDTPASIREFLSRYRADGLLRYVDGTVEELRPVWSGFQIQPSVDTGDSDLHSVPVRVYDAEGRWRSTLHPGADLTPANLAHDLRLAAS